MKTRRSRSALCLACAAIFAFSPHVASAENKGALRILLVGDSTTIGNVPRVVDPDGLHLEQMIEQLAAVEGLPALEVINTGKGGETAKRLLGSKWYDEQIAHVPDVDYIFLRMGINDWFKCDDFSAEFPTQMKALIAQLHQDHSNAKIILSTICRFMPHDECVQVNDFIGQVAQEEGLDLFDLYTPYNQYLTDNGPNNLNIRQIALKDLPEKYLESLRPYTRTAWWKGNWDERVVQVNDTSLDPIFGHIEGWYGDRHPNSTGYNLIAVETVKYLAPILRQKILNESREPGIQYRVLPAHVD